MSIAIKTAIINTAEFYGRQLSESVLGMYAKDLEGLDEAAVVDAYKRYRRNPANRVFPLPAQIMEMVAPEMYVAVETQAREIAQRIVGGISKFGWCNGKQAELAIGPEGWALVQRMGGWGYLCETTTPKQATFLQVQLRDQLEGILRYGGHAVEKAIGVGHRASAGELTDGADIIRAIVSRSDDKDTP